MRTVLLRETPVVATDGHIGKVAGPHAELPQRRVPRVLVSEGRFAWGHRMVALPMSFVPRFNDWGRRSRPQWGQSTTPSAQHYIGDMGGGRCLAQPRVTRPRSGSKQQGDVGSTDVVRRVDALGLHVLAGRQVIALALSAHCFRCSRSPPPPSGRWPCH